MARPVSHFYRLFVGHFLDQLLPISRHLSFPHIGLIVCMWFLCYSVKIPIGDKDCSNRSVGPFGGTSVKVSLDIGWNRNALVFNSINMWCKQQKSHCISTPTYKRAIYKNNCRERAMQIGNPSSQIKTYSSRPVHHRPGPFLSSIYSSFFFIKITFLNHFLVFGLYEFFLSLDSKWSKLFFEFFSNWSRTNQEL